MTTDFVSKTETEKLKEVNVKKSEGDSEKQKAQFIKCAGFKSKDLDKLIQIERKITTFKACLFSERHDVPYVDEFIYESGFTDAQFTNYEFQYNKAKEFLKKVPEDKTLIIYCTGCQPALASVIKACFDEKRNLILKHYNGITKKYDSQIMWSQFAELPKETSLYDKFKFNLYTYDTDIEKLIDDGKGYTITVKVTDPDTGQIKDHANLLFDTEEKGWAVYPTLVSSINDSSLGNTRNVTSLFFTEFTLTETDILFGQVYSKSFNTR